MEKKNKESMTPQLDPNEKRLRKLLGPEFGWISKNCYDLRPSGHVWLPQRSIEAE